MFLKNSPRAIFLLTVNITTKKNFEYNKLLYGLNGEIFMSNVITVISLGAGAILIVLVIAGTVRLVRKTKEYNPDHDLDDIEKFLDEDED